LQGAKAPQRGLQAAALERNTQAGGGRGSDQGIRQLERANGSSRKRLVADGFAGCTIDDRLKKRIERFASNQPLNRFVHLRPRYAQERRGRCERLSNSGAGWIKVFLQGGAMSD
jgi:hypothetical protein